MMSLSATASVKPVIRSRASADRGGAARQAAKTTTASVGLGRRDALKFGGLGLGSAVQLLLASNAWALIPGNDDEDDELLAKAKANRSERIQADRKLEKSYVTKNDLKLDADTSKVQVAVFKLSKAGGLIESGNLALAAEALGSTGKGDWEAELSGAGSKLGKDPKAFIDDVANLKLACASGDATKAKSAYVTAARSLEGYAKATNTAENVKLL